MKMCVQILKSGFLLIAAMSVLTFLGCAKKNSGGARVSLGAQVADPSLESEFIGEDDLVAVELEVQGPNVAPGTIADPTIVAEPESEGGNAGEEEEEMVPPEEEPEMPPARVIPDGHYAKMDGGVLRTFRAFDSQYFCENDFAEKFSNFTYEDLDNENLSLLTSQRSEIIGLPCDGHYVRDNGGTRITIVVVNGKYCENSVGVESSDRDYIDLSANNYNYLQANLSQFFGAPCR